MGDVIAVFGAKFRSLRREYKPLVLLVLAISSLLVAGFVWAHKNVQIVVDDQVIAVETFYNNPEQVLAQAGVRLGPQDEYRLSTAKLTNGSKIIVSRAVPVTVTYQGQRHSFLTGKPTVGEVVASLAIPQNGIKIVPSADIKPTAGMNIKVITVTEKQTIERQPIPHAVVHRPDPALEKGLEQVVQAGKNGEKLATIKIVYEDGVEVARETLAEEVITTPQPEIRHIGMRDTVETSRGTLRFRRVYWMEATAYNPTDGAPHGLTATGIPARRGIVAVDPKVIPLGTRVYVPGYGVALAADVGGAIKGNRIDLCMEGYDEAWNFGRRMVKVYVLEE